MHSIDKKNWNNYTQFLRASLEEASTIKNSTTAKEYLCKYVNMMGYDRDKSEKERRMTYLNDIINNDLLPHLGNSYKRKGYFLGFMVLKLLNVFA